MLNSKQKSYLYSVIHDIVSYPHKIEYIMNLESNVKDPETKLYIDKIREKFGKISTRKDIHEVLNKLNICDEVEKQVKGMFHLFLKEKSEK